MLVQILLVVNFKSYDEETGALRPRKFQFCQHFSSLGHLTVQKIAHFIQYILVFILEGASITSILNATDIGY